LFFLKISDGENIFDGDDDNVIVFCPPLDPDDGDDDNVIGRASSSTATASCRLLGARWAYRRVVLISLCPARTLTVARGTPLEIRREQNV